MKGVADQYRARVGNWRVRFIVNRQQRILTVLTIKPRGDAYKGA
jgi:mRNA-degrading endonuclease RelE of RelBE toxin-antitoxin system